MSLLHRLMALWSSKCTTTEMAMRGHFAQILANPRDMIHVGKSYSQAQALKELKQDQDKHT